MLQYVFIGVIIGILLLILYCGRAGSDRGQNHDQNGGMFPVDLGNNELTREEKEERRFWILSSVIIKVKSCNLSDDEELSVESLGLTNISSKITQNTLESNQASKNEGSAPDYDPEASNDDTPEELYEANGTRKDGYMERTEPLNSLSLRNSTHSTSPNSEGKGRKRGKDNFMIETLRSFRLSRRSLVHSSRSSIYSEKECPICLEAYKGNEELCWSKNKKCKHAFHLDCMIEWLMVHDDCPLCRSNYLEVEEESDLAKANKYTTTL